VPGAAALNRIGSAQPITAEFPAKDLAMDPCRPQFHLLPKANWMNDPNAPIYWKGNYHMFYQYNPDGAYWGNMHWGHAVSPDMVHWRHLPIALAPTPGGPDSDGCFTGTAAVQDGRVAIVYTGVKVVPPEQATIMGSAPPLRETQCMAVSDDPDLLTWTKGSAPILAAPPQGLQVNGFRDPSPWRRGEWWYMVTAAGIPNQGGCVLLYRSKDLRSWEYMHLLSKTDRDGPAAFNPLSPWDVWECPEFFDLGDWHVLIYSTGRRTHWQSGKLDLEKMIFHPMQAGIMDYGSFYAAKTQLDKSGNRILWGWIQESRSVEESKTAGWAGVMSLPRSLTVAGDGRLRTQVAVQVNQLRSTEQRLKVTEDEEKNQAQINSMRLNGLCGEVLCTVRRTEEAFKLALSGSSQNSSPVLTLRYDPHHPAQILVDAYPLPILPGANKNLDIHLYIDNSVIEVFINSEAVYTKRFYDSDISAQSLQLQWTGRSADISNFQVWQLTPISNDRLTT
ncbi:MAG: glycoside hydrolase family 32 protein, partial [Terracidiphilus sp.]